jgi:7-cyano-7-deazaguanine tRNA-ribosyltransferase
MFETRFKDAQGRIGSFRVGGKALETPLILPVINPNVDVISAREIGDIGFSALITNSYIIYRNESLREKALSGGVKNLIGFEGVVMTDSGSYQLYQYGEVEISPDEIVCFQKEIGSDIGVILDIPTPPDASYNQTKKDLEETIRRAKEAVSLKEDMLLAGTVQGSTHLQLREESAKAMSELDFDIYPIGGVVPLMEAYRFEELSRIILHSKKYIPPNKPVHLFGAGHPMMFALVVALGCDIFDSAAYFLYARDGRYITTSGTFKLNEMRILPCECQVCSNFEIDVLKNSNEKVKLLALHNLYITKREIEIVKEAIYHGALWELVETRCRAHPRLLDALRIISRYPIERYDPLSKPRAFFYSGPESLNRPEVKRHMQRLSRIKPKAKTLVLIPFKTRRDPKSKLGSNSDFHVCYVSPVFGIIPLEVEEIYPLMQHIAPKILDESQISMMKRTVREYAEGFDKVFYDKELKFLQIKGEIKGELELKEDTTIKLIGMGDYQFGRGAGVVLFNKCSGKYSQTGRLRHILEGENIVATIRASDGIIVPTLEGAKRLLKLKSPRNRVVVEDEEVCNYIREGKSVFAKFITYCDPEIVPGSEVIVVNKADEFVGWGKTLLDSRELLAFHVGVGVKTRGSIKE